MVISIKDTSRSSEKIKSILEINASRPVAKWLDAGANQEAKVVAVPTREDIDLEVDETLIVELYSK